MPRRTPLYITPLFIVILIASWSGAAGAGEVYRIGIAAAPASQNPFAVFGASEAGYGDRAASRDVYASLAAVVPPRFDYAPQVAAFIPEPAEMERETIDGTPYYTAEVPLRRDLFWSDGTKLGAGDVAFTFWAVLSLGPDALGGDWALAVRPEVVERVEAVDEYTVKFYFKRLPTVGEWHFGALLAPILQRRQWEAHVNRALASPDPVEAIRAADVPPVALGPFSPGPAEAGALRVNVSNPHDVRADERIVLFEGGGVAVENSATGYRHRSGGEGAVELVIERGNVDRVEYRVVDGPEEAARALAAGEIDYWQSPSGLDRAAVERLARTPGVEIVENPTNTMFYLAYNFRRRPMDDLAFRKAVGALIDREYVAETVLAGQVEPMAGYVPAGNPAWTRPGVEAAGGGLGGPAERMAEAVRLLEEAGYTWRVKPRVDLEGGSYTPGEGLTMPDGRRVPELAIVAPSADYDPLRSAVARAIEGWVEDLGVRVDLELGSFDAVSERVFFRHDFDMHILGWDLGDPSYPEYLAAFFHPGEGGPGGWNTGGYNSPEYAALAERFLSARTLEEARRTAREMQELLARDHVYTVLFATKIVEAYRSDRIEFPYTRVLGGLQGAPNGLAPFVRVLR